MINHHTTKQTYEKINNHPRRVSSYFDGSSTKHANLGLVIYMVGVWQSRSWNFWNFDHAGHHHQC